MPKGEIIFVSLVPGWQLVVKRRPMRKMKNKSQKKEMLTEYEFASGVRGKYVARYGEGTNIVLIEPDLAKVFPDSRSVNKALRQIVKQLNKHVSGQE
jgi:hypothetical protein